MLAPVKGIFYRLRDVDMGRKFMNRLNYLLRKLQRECLFFAGSIFGSREYASIVIVTRSRSGSNLLCSLLESHPQAFVWREVFRRPHYFTPVLTERLVTGRYLRRYRAVFYKVFYYHRVPAGYWDRLVEDERIRIIHLIRRNYLDIFVSQRQAAASGEWESFGADNARHSAMARLHVRVDELMEFLERTDSQVSSFEARIANRANVLNLTYDQIAGPEILERIRSFLDGDLDPARFGQARNVRQGTSRLNDRIDNFDEVRKALMNSRWRHLLDQVDAPIEAGGFRPPPQ